MRMVPILRKRRKRRRWRNWRRNWQVEKQVRRYSHEQWPKVLFHDGSTPTLHIQISRKKLLHLGKQIADAETLLKTLLQRWRSISCWRSWDRKAWNWTQNAHRHHQDALLSRGNIHDELDGATSQTKLWWRPDFPQKCVPTQWRYFSGRRKQHADRRVSFNGKSTFQSSRWKSCAIWWMRKH